MKRVMPFVQATREKIDAIGLQALSLTLDFDEMDVLSKNIVYLENTLDVSIKVTSLDPFRLAFIDRIHFFPLQQCFYGIFL